MNHIFKVFLKSYIFFILAFTGWEINWSLCVLKVSVFSLFDSRADSLLPSLLLHPSFSLALSLESEVECWLSEGVHSESALDRPEWCCAALLPFSTEPWFGPHWSGSQALLSAPPVARWAAFLIPADVNPCSARSWRSHSFNRGGIRSFH